MNKKDITIFILLAIIAAFAIFLFYKGVMESQNQYYENGYGEGVNQGVIALATQQTSTGNIGLINQTGGLEFRNINEICGVGE